MKTHTTLMVLPLLMAQALGQSGVVEFSPRTAIQEVAKLRLPAPATEPIWEEDTNPNTSPLVWRLPNFEPYANVQLVSSIRNGSDVCVAFIFTFEKTNPRVKRMFEQMHRMAMPNEYAQWNGKLLFVRIFRRNATGKWSPVLSVFPTTIWRSTINATVKGVEMAALNEFVIVFEAKWMMEQGASNWFSTKTVMDIHGETKMRLKLQSNPNLLVVAGEGEPFRYIPESDWWENFDEWNVDPLKQTDDRSALKRERESRARVSGVLGRNNTQY